MKMSLLVAFGAVTLAAGRVQAQSLFYDSCTGTRGRSADIQAQLFYTATATGSRVMGMSCEDLKSLTRNAQMIELALYPATLAVTLSPMRAELAASLAELGLTMANPAILGVTVLGATGFVVVYLVLKVTLDECERMDREQLRATILEEVERKYGVSGRGVDLQIKR